MNALILGAGMMGSAIVFDLARSSRVERITVGDVEVQRAEQIARKLGSTKISAISIDVRDDDQVFKLMRDFDVTISAVGFQYNDVLTSVAVKAKRNFCDLGGSDHILAKQKAHDEEAKRSGVTIIPNCGLAPGMANVIAMHGVKRFKRVTNIHIRVGGLPQHPKPPLHYQLVFFVDGLIKEYTERAKILKDGTIDYVEPLTGVESIEFSESIMPLEAFYTSGGVSLLPELLQGKVDSVDYKTIRYAGHAEKMRTLLDIGFASAEPIRIGQHLATPRELFAELLKKKFAFGDKDVVFLRVIIQGKRNGKGATLVYSIVDRYDDNTSLTAMMRTTAFPTSIIAQMVAIGEISAKGVLTPEECVPAETFMTELQRRGINISESWD